MKPFGKTPDQIAYWGNGGGVCATEAANGAKIVSISGFVLYTGVTVKVMFINGNSNNAPTLNVNSTGVKNIKVVKAGSKITPPVHTGKWRGASSATIEGWQPLTTLELMYDGTDWVIIGNPVVEDYYSESENYIVYANGLIEQYAYLHQPTSNELTIDFPIVFNNANYYASVTPSPYYPSYASTVYAIGITNMTTSSMQTNCYTGGVGTEGRFWFVKGC